MSFRAVKSRDAGGVRGGRAQIRVSDGVRKQQRKKERGSRLVD